MSKYYTLIYYFVFREDPENVDGLPKIPAQPIGYDDARKLLEKMGGDDSPESWRGGMKGISYKVTCNSDKDLPFNIEK